jgi:hypothetical protein
LWALESLQQPRQPRSMRPLILMLASFWSSKLSTLPPIETLLSQASRPWQMVRAWFA